MAQHDYVIANGTGAAVRSDLNNALAAIVSQNSGATEPATMYAYQWWADTTTGLLKLRNAANNAWITLRELDGTLTIEAGTVSAPGLAFASDLNTGVWSPGADQFAIGTNGVERVEWGTSEVVFNDGGANYDFRIEGDTNANLFFVDASAEAVGIGTTSPGYALDVQIATSSANTGARIYNSTVGTGNSASLSFSVANTFSSANQHAAIQAINEVSTNTLTSLAFLTSGGSSAGNATERARIDSSGRLLVGTSSYSGEGLLVAQGYAGSTSGEGSCALLRGGTVTAADQALGTVNFGQSANVGATIKAISEGSWTSGSNHRSRLVFSTTPDSGSSPVERLRITSAGNVRLGSASAYNSEFFTVDNGGGATSEITAFGASGGVNHRFYFHTGAAGNAAGTVYWTNSNNTTGRSINAGGTINASGADYAEYMVKAGDFTIFKGDVCGVNADGLLTLRFNDAVSFVVKSTSPSYVGNDGWGIGYEDDPEGLEIARQAVDRIAFAGQVPVNVIGATPGQYIVPVATADGGIEGIAKSEVDLTLAEYMRAVGKVIAIEDDGRARIIVKVA